MKAAALFLVLAITILACAEDDGKYRPEVIATTLRPVPSPVFTTTTRIPYYKYNDPRYNPWNSRPYDHIDRYPGRYDVAKPVIGRPYSDWRTVRLDEKVDAKGYRYVYETVGGILAEEVGTFENIGLKTEGVRAQGYVQITDPRDGVTYRIDYQSDIKDPYVARGNREVLRTPPTIVKLLALLEAHK